MRNRIRLEALFAGVDELDIVGRNLSQSANTFLSNVGVGFKILYERFENEINQINIDIPLDIISNTIKDTFVDISDALSNCLNRQ